MKGPTHGWRCGATRIAALQRVAVPVTYAERLDSVISGRNESDHGKEVRCTAAGISGTAEIARAGSGLSSCFAGRAGADKPAVLGTTSDLTLASLTTERVANRSGQLKRDTMAETTAGRRHRQHQLARRTWHAWLVLQRAVECSEACPEPFREGPASAVLGRGSDAHQSDRRLR